MVDGASAANDHLQGVSGHVLSSEAENVRSNAHRMAFHVIWTCLGLSERAADVARKNSKLVLN
jgi:hypothetical protein